MTRFNPCVLLLGVVLATPLGCSSKSTTTEGSGEASGEGSGAAPVPVEVEAVRRADMERTISATTTLRAARSTAVSALAGGRLVELTPRLGDRVRAGQRIGRIESPELGLAVAEAERTLRAIEEERLRASPLVERGYLPRQIVDEIAARRIPVEGALSRARAALAEAELKAPFDGVVTRRAMEPGAAVTPGAAILEIADDAGLEAAFAVPERWLAELAVGTPARLVADAIPGQTWQVAAGSIDPAVDPASGTATVRVPLPHADEGSGSPRLLRSGMFVRARFVVDVHRGVPSVASRAVMYRGQDASVFRLVEAADGRVTVERVAVELGYESDGRVEVKAGLNAGDRVVVVGQSGLDAGTRVLPRTQEGSGAPAR
jgi:membrane fusion protein (multidrug efflux system)